MCLRLLSNLCLPAAPAAAAGVEPGGRAQRAGGEGLGGVQAPICVRRWKQQLQTCADQQRLPSLTPSRRDSSDGQTPRAVKQRAVQRQAGVPPVPLRSAPCPGSCPALPTSNLRSWVETVHFPSLNLYYYRISKTTKPTTQLQKEFTEKCEAACV